MNILLIKIKRKFLFILNKILNLLELEIKEKTISNEQVIKNLITIEDPIILNSIYRILIQLFLMLVQIRGKL